MLSLIAWSTYDDLLHFESPSWQSQHFTDGNPDIGIILLILSSSLSLSLGYLPSFRDSAGRLRVLARDELSMFS